MALRQSKMVLCIAVKVLVMVLFAEAQYEVKREISVANAGENITLICKTYTRRETNTYWVKDNDYFIAAVNKGSPKGWLQDDSLFTQSYEIKAYSGLFKLYIYDASAETATYACRNGNIPIQEYVVRVIGCPTCFVNSSSSHDLEQPRKDVNCLLNNFHTAERIRLHITMNGNRMNTAIIEGSILTFNIPNTMKYDTIRVEFNPFTDALTNIICIVPAQLTIPQSNTSVKLSPSTSLMTKSPTSSSSAKSLATKSEKTSETTSAAITTTGTKSYDLTPKSSSSPIMDTSYLPSGTTTSSSSPSITKSETSSSTTSATTTSNQARKNINPGTENNTNNKGITIIIIAILGAILMIVVIVIIILVLRLKQRRDRQHGRRNEGEINVAVREQDTCYEPIGGLSGIREGELINNVLYESSDGIIQSSILRSGDDQLDTDLYTVPDKTGIINRVAKSKRVSASSNGNSSVNRHQHEQKEFKQEDQQLNVDMPNLGAGDDGDINIPLYAMPDKGPRSTRNTTNTSPGSASTEGGVDIPLYALPDKRPGSNRNIIKATPGPGTRNEGDEIPLYALPDKRPGSNRNIIKATPGPEKRNEGDEIQLCAVLNKEPGSKENRPKMKSKPGGQSVALNKDDTHDEEALYAEVDKSN